ncbi:MAG: hypothetical protein ACTTH5_04230 [Wolinella sp.]
MSKELQLQSARRTFDGFVTSIDNYFAYKEESEKRILYLMLSALIFFAFYFLLYPYMEEWVVQKEAVHSEVYTALQKSQSYINEIDRTGGIPARRNAVQKTLEHLGEAEERAKKAEATLQKVYKMSYAWYFTLDFAMKSATRLGLEVLNSSLGKSEGKGVGGLEKSWMKLKGRGSKRAILDYIYFLEHYGPFVSLEHISLIPRGSGILEFEILVENQKGSL